MAAARLSLLVFIAILTERAGVLPPYLPALNLDNQPVERDILIEQYFSTRLGYDEILLFLGLLHGITLSIRQLKRILRARGLKRRGNCSDPRQICCTVQEELRGSGSTIGYRQMTQRLAVDKETVRALLKILDPDGVAARSRLHRHRLQRRQYRTRVQITYGILMYMTS